MISSAPRGISRSVAALSYQTFNNQHSLSSHPYGTKELLVPIEESRLLRDVLQNDSVTLVEMNGGHHGFDTLASPRAFKAMDALEAWLIDFEHVHFPSVSVKPNH
eukprot:m.108521 g.108521  ORF g.108521 m.108521 type:complete len:105 (+) comp51739_c0_seq6:243-557(+)